MRCAGGGAGPSRRVACSADTKMPGEQGGFRIIKNQGREDPPPPPEQSDHRGKKRNLPLGKSDPFCFFGTPIFVSPPPPPPLKRSPEVGAGA